MTTIKATRKRTAFTALLTAVCMLAFVTVASAAMIDDDDVGHFLKGTNAADTINGNGGDDKIAARRGDDTLDGGAGNDQIRANRGNDLVYGGDGDDVLFGGLGNDLQHGGVGNDTIYASRGRDESWGDEGNDTLWAMARLDRRGAHDFRGDTLHGGDGDDTFRARDGEGDVIDCGDGNDTAILDWKDRIDDATSDNKNGSCENVFRKKRATRSDAEEVANP